MKTNSLYLSRNFQRRTFKTLVKIARIILLPLVILGELSAKIIPDQVIDISFKQIAIFAINIYQKYISPYKGFSCSHRVLYGGDSCSQYAKQMLTHQRLEDAIPLARHRFKMCKEAYLILRTESNYQKDKRGEWKCEPSCDPCECIPEPDCGDCDFDCG